MAARTRYPIAAVLAAEYPIAAPHRPAFPLRLLLVLAILPLLLIASLLVVYRQQQADLIYTGVHVFGVDLSHMTEEQATAALSQGLAAQTRRNFNLRYDNDAVTLSLREMGVQPSDQEIQALVQRAWTVGREGDLGRWIRAQYELWRRGYDLPASLTFDRSRAEEVLGRVAMDVERATVNADLKVEPAGDRFEIHTTPSATGRRLNAAATLDRFQKSLAGTLPKSLDLVLDEVPPTISDNDLAPAIQTIQAVLGSPLAFKDGARTWNLQPKEAFPMLEITGLAEGTPPVEAHLNDEKLTQWVEKIAREADQPAQNPVLAVNGDQVVTRPGQPGKLADTQATVDAAKQAVVQPVAPDQPRSVDIVFKEDKPWLTEADLTAAKDAANKQLGLPITLEPPPGTLGATSDPPQKWVLSRSQLAQWLVMPDTQHVPREYATMPAAARPQFQVSLDSGRVTNYLAAEVAPWVSVDPVDAKLEMKTTRVERPNPAYKPPTPLSSPSTANSLSALSSSSSTSTSSDPTSAVPPTATVTPAATVPATIQESRYTVELQPARVGRGPNYAATFAALMTLFRTPPPANADPKAVQEQRTVTVVLTDRPVQVKDSDLIPARDLANQLIGEPITVRWKDTTWTVTRDELAAMLRYQNDSKGKLTTYLTRDGLLAKATAIANQANLLPDAPRASTGELLPLDVPRTASAIWQIATDQATNRVTDVVWTEEELPAEPAATPGADAKPTTVAPPSTSTGASSATAATRPSPTSAGATPTPAAH